MRSILAQFLILFALIAAFEQFSRTSLPPGKKRPFLFDPSGGLHGDLAVGSGFDFSYLDPLLGWSHGPQAEGKTLGNDYRVYGNEDPRALRIVITGGSTSDSIPDPRGIWPQVLIDQLRAQGYCVTGFFGAVAGYDTKQELIKILRDRPSLKPHLHLTYSGVNELSDVSDFFPSHFSVNLLQLFPDYRKTLLFPNTTLFLAETFGEKSLIKGINKGLPIPPNGHERWVGNVRAMHGLAKEFGYEFLALLQPTLGVGKYSPSAEESARISEQKLAERWRPIYLGGREAVRKLPFAADLSDAFAGKSGLYFDHCHVNDEGHKLVATRVHEELKSRYAGLLRKFRFRCQ